MWLPCLIFALRKDCDVLLGQCQGDVTLLLIPYTGRMLIYIFAEITDMMMTFISPQKVIPLPHIQYKAVKWYKLSSQDTAQIWDCFCMHNLPTFKIVTLTHGQGPIEVLKLTSRQSKVKIVTVTCEHLATVGLVTLINPAYRQVKTLESGLSQLKRCWLIPGLRAMGTIIGLYQCKYVGADCDFRT